MGIILHTCFVYPTHILDSGLSSESSASTCDYTPVSTTLTTKKGIVSTIAGSVIGSSIVLLLLCVVSVLLVVCIGRRRRIKLSKSHDNDLDLTVNLVNPIYVPGGKLQLYNIMVIEYLTWGIKRHCTMIFPRINLIRFALYNVFSPVSRVGQSVHPCAMYTHTHIHTPPTHILGTSHNKFPAVSYTAVKTDLAATVGVAHDYDEINNGGEVRVSRSISSINDYCRTPHGERKTFQLTITVK